MDGLPVDTTRNYALNPMIGLRPPIFGGITGAFGGELIRVSADSITAANIGRFYRSIQGGITPLAHGSD